MGGGWSEVGVEGVPLELVYRVLSHVSLQDLTTLLATSSYLKNLIEESPLLWSHAHTKNLWPNVKTLHWFERAANCGNVGASIKLAVALLYNEGVARGKPVRYGELAVSLFERLETNSSVGSWSQLWILYRPPWGAQPLCCKRYVYTRVAHIAQMTGAAWAVRVLSHITETAEDRRGRLYPFDVNWTKMAVQGGDLPARVQQWQCRYKRRHQEGTLDPGTQLQASRELRELCLTGYYPAMLTLSHFLATSRLPSNQFVTEIQEFLQSSPPSGTWYALNYQRHVTPHMHHVLVDWLCEVANMKLHNSRALHTATQVVEAYLSVEQVKCCRLQLVGITALLLATRFVPGASLLTVREASWVTDDTYSYSDVVRTIGHIMAALKATLTLPTILDYATVLLESVRAPVVTQEWTWFLCDLATTCCFPPRTTLAQISSACLLLGYILSRLPWPNLFVISGFTLQQLLQPLAIIYSKNFDIEGNKCQRRGIIDRYSQAMFSTERVGLLPVLPLEDLLAALSLSEPDYLTMVTERPPSPDNIGTSSIPVETTGSQMACKERVFRPLQADFSHQATPQCSIPPKGVVDFPVGGCCLESGVSGNWRAGGRSLGTSGRRHDDRMECSDSESSQEFMNTEMSPKLEKPHSRTIYLPNLEKNEAQSNRFSMLGENRPGNPIAQVRDEHNQACGVLPTPDHRQHQSSENQGAQSKVVTESLSKTTDSEENSDILPEGCGGQGTTYARVNLKRKLENASESDRSEKCLVLDVGNLQLG